MRRAASIPWNLPIVSPARLLQLDHLPDEVVGKLVATLYDQPASQVLSALILVCFELVCYRGTGTGWYLVGALYSGSIGIWRYSQSRDFKRHGQTGDPERWALRSLYSGWATALGWAALVLVLPFEPDRAISTVLLGLHAGLTVGGSIRNGAVLVVARGQIVIGTAPLIVACLVSHNPFLNYYGIVVILFAVTACGMAKFIFKQNCELLSRQQEATALAAELELRNACLSEQAITDPLTGLLNRRALDMAAAREWRTANRHDRPLSVLMIDIDHFKLFNDHYGHQGGDQCLREIASLLTSKIRRPVDVIARYGGEEFIAILPSVDVRGAASVASAVLSELSRRAIKHEAAPRGLVTISIGVAGSVGSKIASVTHLIWEADRALYAAKRRGRNQLVTHDELVADENLERLEI